MRGGHSQQASHLRPSSASPVRPVTHTWHAHLTRTHALLLLLLPFRLRTPVAVLLMKHQNIKHLWNALRISLTTHTAAFRGPAALPCATERSLHQWWRDDRRRQHVYGAIGDPDATNTPRRGAIPKDDHLAPCGNGLRRQAGLDSWLSVRAREACAPCCYPSVAVATLHATVFQTTGSQVYLNALVQRRHYHLCVNFANAGQLLAFSCVSQP